MEIRWTGGTGLKGCSASGRSEFRALATLVMAEARPGGPPPLSAVLIDGPGGAQPVRVRRVGQSAPAQEDDDEQRDQPAEEHVGQEMAAESEAKHARAGAESERAPPSAGARKGGGTSIAGATIQNPVAASPETNEQLCWQAPSKRYQGLNSSSPPKSTDVDGARPVRVVLEAEVDDQPRADRHRREQEDRRRRPLGRLGDRAAESGAEA